MRYDFETLAPAAEHGIPWLHTTHTHTAAHPEYVNFGVAEMKFALLPEIAETLAQLGQAGTLGYVDPTPAFRDAVAAWQKSRHDWDIQADWYRLLFGVVPCIGAAIRAFTRPGEGVIVQTPAYPPFFSAVRDNGRRLAENRLILRGNRWEMDFDGLEALAAQPDTTAMLLCSPHNPTGRVWSPDELSRVADICRRHGVYVISDEIHSDIIMPGHTHTVFSKAAKGARHTVLNAPSKTFSIPGMTCAFSFTPDAADRAVLHRVMARDMGGYTNAPGIAVCAAAYTHGAAWLDECCAVIAHNTDLLRDALTAYLPEVRLYDAEGTYLRWADFSALGLDRKALEAAFERAHVHAFAGSGFELRESLCVRLNVACPSRFIEPAVRRLAEAAKEGVRL